MRAFQLLEYVGPTGLQLADRPAPEPGADEVLMEVRATG